MNSNVLKGMILVVMILYIVSPIDVCLGSTDDIIALLLGIEAQNWSLKTINFNKNKEE